MSTLTVSLPLSQRKGVIALPWPESTTFKSSQGASPSLG